MVPKASVIARYWIVLLALQPHIVSAGPSDYQCVVKQQLVPSYLIPGAGPGKGELRPAPNPAFVGERFAVDRASGRVIGSLFDTADASEVKLIHRGSENMAFKTITIGEGKIKLLVIRENTTSSEKDFYGVFHPIVLAGTCR